MAQTTRERIIANPGRRRKKLSAKQIRFFGTARQRAALKGTRKRAKAHTHRRRTRTNRGEIIGYTFPSRTNTGRKKGTKMAATRKRRRRRSNAGYGATKPRRRRRARAKSNPGRRHHGYTHRRRRRAVSNPGRRRRSYRRNPGMASIGGIGNLAMNAVFVIAGAVGSKLLTQMVLGANNTGMVGYAGNAVAGGVLWFLAEKVLKNRDAAKGVIAGTAVQIVLRLINDYTPFGSYVANLGMGDYQAQSFVSPQVLVDPFNSAEIQIPAAYRALAAAPAAAGMAGWQNVGDYGGGSGSY